MTKAVDDDCLPKIKRLHEASAGFPERPLPAASPHVAVSCHSNRRRRARPDHRNGEPESHASGTGREADVPPGGCMPIGLTASGEIVFPIQCKEFIDRERGKAVEQTPPAAAGKPVTADEKPAAEPKARCGAREAGRQGIGSRGAAARRYTGDQQTGR